MKAFICALLFLLFLSFPLDPALATVNCHCFQERTYNPEKRFAADGYLLATTFNSFLSTVFNVPKRDIVMLKMKGGVQDEEVTIALYVSSQTGIDLEELTDQRKKQSTWQEILRLRKQKETVHPDPLLAAIERGKPDSKVAASITDHILRTFFQLDQNVIDTLRKKKLTDKEMTLFFLLASHIGTSAAQLTNLRRNNGLSLSEIAHNFGFQPGDMQRILSESTLGEPEQETTQPRK